MNNPIIVQLILGMISGLGIYYLVVCWVVVCVIRAKALLLRAGCRGTRRAGLEGPSASPSLWPPGAGTPTESHSRSPILSEHLKRNLIQSN